MTIDTRRVLLAALLTGGTVLGVAGTASAAPEAPAEAISVPAADDDNGDDSGDDNGDDNGGDDDDNGDDDNGDDDNGGDDDGSAPVGGVDAGLGGAASGGNSLPLPLGLAAGAALAAGGAVFLRRRSLGAGE